jgi:hypothetical protein
VAALLLFAPRWWPFLIIGEAGALLTIRIPQIDSYGIPFVAISSITIMPLVACIVKAIPKKISFADDSYWFLPLAAGIPIFTTIVNIGLTFIVMKDVRPGVDWTNSVVIMAGAFLGILTLAPLGLAWKQRAPAFPFPRPLVRDAFIALAANVVLAAFAVLVPKELSDAANILRVSMVLPAVVLTLAHGWRGAAAGVAIANLAIGLTIHHSSQWGSHDPISFSAQLVMVIASSTLLLAGSTVTRHYKVARQHGLDKHESLIFSRAAFSVSEQEIRHRLQKIGGVGDDIHSTLLDVAKGLRERGHHAAALEVQTVAVDKARQYKEQSHIIYPGEIEQLGLYHTLVDGPLAHAWRELCAIGYDLRGDVEILSPDLQLMTYRVVNDVVSTLVATGHHEIVIAARTWKYGRYVGMVIKIAVPRDEGLNSHIQKIENFDVTGRVKACGGKMRRRDSYILFSMIEPAAYRSILQKASNLSTDQLTTPSKAV